MRREIQVNSSSFVEKVCLAIKYFGNKSIIHYGLIDLLHMAWEMKDVGIQFNWKTNIAHVELMIHQTPNL